MDVYPWLKVLHVLLAIVAVGSNITYGVWQVRAAREPQHIGWALRGVKFIDDRIANPAYIGLGAVGVLLVLTGPWRFEMLWIAIAIALYVALMVIGIGVYTPTLSRQIRVYEADGPQSAEFSALSGRSRTVGAVLGVIVVTIVAIMVLKPGV
jgi:uncharacterized membrane protein